MSAVLQPVSIEAQMRHGGCFFLLSLTRKNKPPKPQHEIFLPRLLACFLGKGQHPGWFCYLLPEEQQNSDLLSPHSSSHYLGYSSSLLRLSMLAKEVAKPHSWRRSWGSSGTIQGAAEIKGQIYSHCSPHLKGKGRGKRISPLNTGVPREKDLCISCLSFRSKSLICPAAA